MIFFSGLPRLKPLQKKNHLCGRPWNLWKTECLNSLTLRMMGKKAVSLLMDLIPFDCQISLTLIIKYPLNWFDKSLIYLQNKNTCCEVYGRGDSDIVPQNFGMVWNYLHLLDALFVYFSYLNKLYHKIDLSWKETLKICFVFLCVGFWNSKIFKAGSWGYPRYCSWRQQNSESQTFRGARQTDVWNLVTIPSLPTHI